MDIYMQILFDYSFLMQLDIEFMKPSLVTVIEK